MKYMYVLFLGACLAVMALNAPAKLNQNELNVSGLKNFQINSETMVSAGLPDNTHLEVLAKSGVNRVVDLIPGDRQAEQQIAESLVGDASRVVADAHGLGVTGNARAHGLVGRRRIRPLRVAHFRAHDTRFPLKGQLDAPETPRGKGRLLQQTMIRRLEERYC